jgi:hypothetical protein
MDQYHRPLDEKKERRVAGWRWTLQRRASSGESRGVVARSGGRLMARRPVAARHEWPGARCSRDTNGATGSRPQTSQAGLACSARGGRGYSYASGRGTLIVSGRRARGDQPPSGAQVVANMPTACCVSCWRCDAPRSSRCAMGMSSRCRASGRICRICRTGDECDPARRRRISNTAQRCATTLRELARPPHLVAGPQADTELGARLGWSPTSGSQARRRARVNRESRKMIPEAVS